VDFTELLRVEPDSGNRHRNRSSSIGSAGSVSSIAAWRR